jgi:hypothetical protein
MKKFFFIAAMVSAALISCTKNEPAPSMEAQQEITFMTAPLTKTLSTTQKEFAKTNVFWSWAFLSEEAYPTDATTQLYIGTDTNNGALISYKDNVWKEQGKVHYWPKDKDSRLTFYSYSINDENGKTFTTAPTSLSCTYNDGIQMTGYDVVANKNIDFMVAEVMADQTKNETTDLLMTDGVKTVFRHELSNVNFTIKTTTAYSDKTFTLNSITLNGIAATGDFSQNPDTTDPLTGTWVVKSTDNITVGDTNTPFVDSPVSFAAPRYLFIPQTFTDETVTIVYTIDSTSPVSKEVVTVEKKLSEIFGTAWEHGKKYTCNVKISLNEILWDPAVEDWTAGSSYDWAI